MSPLSAVAEPSGSTATASARLRLVSVHDHVWRLSTVEYDDGLEVRCYECETCDDVLFR